MPQVPQPVERIRHHEVQRAQTEHRQHVRAVHDERVPCDRQYCRNRIERENDICRLDNGKSDKQWSGDEAPSFAPPESVTVQHRTDAHHPRNPRGADFTGSRDDAPFTFLGEQHSPGSEQDESPKWVHDPIKALDEHDPRDDHDRSEDKRTRDAPRQYPTLAFGGNMELRKHDHEDKDVVDR